ncbi:MmcQ/YjbR family DNA-binding protein [Aerococcaceae bacterium NML160702]|nr:MmcQ/YjbR family DNA-binding protein [Aerococcaceae bacterium NML191219]MCW6679906.1 MmcQ/YjbR family DNA-binding protein [Aerococcaceae bacterium NML130460]MCW6681700.1 MmcQ/YjbR family DNA-binding protein [Aerococcaceae bacterium NML160702]MDO4774366.1 MmcQ/YjbR family DNA-binding protein [Aerococcaceae bacterium]
MEQDKVIARKQRFLAYVNNLPCAKAYFRTDWECYYLDLFGKMFGYISSENDENAIITLKGLPDKNEELREIFADVTPGYHMNKTHWNSIKLLTDALSDEQIEQLIQESYELVANKLPLKDRKKLQN